MKTTLMNPTASVVTIIQRGKVTLICQLISLLLNDPFILTVIA